MKDFAASLPKERDFKELGAAYLERAAALASRL